MSLSKWDDCPNARCLGIFSSPEKWDRRPGIPKYSIGTRQLEPLILFYFKAISNHYINIGPLRRT